MSGKSVLRSSLLAASILMTPAVAGCASAYYGAMEQFGVEKRDLLVERVVKAAAQQEEAKEEFVSALDAFRAVVNFDGGELEATYDKLNASYEAADREAERVRTRVKDVQIVAKDLFKEWRKELDQYSSASLRSASEQQLIETETRYAELDRRMQKASASMDPVLAVFKDRVLFLKHNLNSRAIAALEGEAAQIETDVSKLIADMESSIAEADAFIKDMRSAQS
jgi:hypothetical protein